MITGEQLRVARKDKRWTQVKAADRLGVSQTYLSLLENGDRPIPAALAQKAVSLFSLPLSALPVTANVYGAHRETDQDELAEELAALGYPGYSYLQSHKKRNPAEVLVKALSAENLDSRLIEALPWVVLKYPDLDWDWLLPVVKVHDLQNRLGFITSIARKLAEFEGKTKAALLAQREAAIERARMAREDTLCHESLSQAERQWLREHRTAEARHWNLLTDLAPQHLSYAKG
ncbi:MAG TPA: helix-turn-helix transcriptional regulator [Terriglobales bacterium]